MLSPHPLHPSPLPPQGLECPQETHLRSTLAWAGGLSPQPCNAHRYPLPRPVLYPLSHPAGAPSSSCKDKCVYSRPSEHPWLQRLCKGITHHPRATRLQEVESTFKYLKPQPRNPVAHPVSPRSPLSRTLLPAMDSLSLPGAAPGARWQLRKRRWV